MVFSFFRPTPMELIIKMLPGYLQETERPLQKQADALYVSTKEQEFLKWIVCVRSLTAGVVLSSVPLAAAVVSRAMRAPNEAKYKELRQAVSRMCLQSSFEATNRRIQSDPLFKNLISLESQACWALVHSKTEEYLMSGEPDIHSWAHELGLMYKFLIEEMVTPKGFEEMKAKMAEERIEEWQMNVDSFCNNFANQHSSVLSTFVTELADLMEAKGTIL